MDASESIAALAAPGAEAAGLVIDSVTVSDRGSRTLVVVTVDLPEDAIGSADIDDIAAASRAIAAALDQAQTVPGSYTLEVGTPGIDRPLTEERHFKRARTRKVGVGLADGRTLTGRLTAVEDGALVLATNDGEISIALTDVTVGEILLEMSR